MIDSGSYSFQQLLWADFTVQRPEPSDPALRYGGAGRSEDKLHHFTGTPFYQALLPETQNILRHIRRVEWLRPPQVDALELYVYLKEVQGNPTTQQLYRDVLLGDIEGKSALELTAEELERLQAAQAQIMAIEETLMGVDYPNAIYSLAMGTGKTVLVAAMIFYDFVLSWKYPDDARFAKNALVFCPDLTIIESLREIQELDRSRIMPGEYVNFLEANLKFHYLADSGAGLTVLPGSAYNVIVSNVQKIILRRYSRPSAARTLFGDTRRAEAELVSNARLQRLQELDNLAVFVDEAHHSFGRSLEGDLKRVRETINHLHTRTPLVSCVNLTGTPYVNNRMLPEVVYHYPLADSIRDGHLKEVRFYDYTRVKTEEFVRDVVDRFWETYGEERREGLLPHEQVEEIYFTGGVTDPAHNEFYVEYYDEQTGQWRKYFSDFFLRLAGDGWMALEVKREDQTEHSNVKAKDEAARQVFEALNDILYHVKPGDEIRRGEIHDIFRHAASRPSLSG